MDPQQILQRLREAEQQARQAEQQARQAEQQARQAGQQARQAEQRAEEAEQRAGQAEERNRLTTFKEFIRASHDHLSKPLQVQSNKSLTTKGSITSVKRKLCPTNLRPWEEFLQIQQRLFDKTYSFFHSPSQPPSQLFSPVLYLEELSRRVCGRKLASERDLESYVRFAVDDHVADIIKKLSAIPEAREAFCLRDGIIFENHANTLSDFAEEVQQRLHIGAPYTPGRGPAELQSTRPTYADQICVYRDTGGAQLPLLIVEYKPPHKLSVETLRTGLRNMNVPKEVINRPTIPTDPEEKLKYNAEKLVAAVVTQTFSQMIENGLEYSYISTGEAVVFLQVEQDDPTSVYYHLTEPNKEAEIIDEYGFRYPHTAIAQILCFCLMALGSDQRSQSWRDNAMRQLQRYEIDYECVLRQIPEKERNTTPSSAFKGRKYPINPRSPYLLRKRRTRNRCSSDEAPTEDPSHHSSDDSEEEYESPNTPIKTKRIAKNKDVKGKGKGAQGGDQRRNYCTQSCLRGLVRQTALDANCPNVSAHRQGGIGDRHQITKLEFRQMIRQQLSEDLDHNCEPLGKQGARGALFRITLAGFGYTLVGKGTVEVFVQDLRHEARTYQRLEELQGKSIPVYLGNIDLPRIYYLDFGVRIQQMLMMSWAGETANADPEAKQFSIKEQVQSLVKEMGRLGVVHGDIRGPNTLWSRELGRVMLIDFERATWAPSARFKGSTLKGMSTLQETSTSRRNKGYDAHVGTKKTTTHFGKLGRLFPGDMATQEIQ